MQRLSVLAALSLIVLGCAKSDESNNAISATTNPTSTIPVSRDNLQHEIQNLKIEKQKLEAQLEVTRLKAELADLRASQNRPNSSAPAQPRQAIATSPQTVRGTSAHASQTAHTTGTQRNSKAQDSAPSDRGQQTLDFWNKLNTIIDTEASMRAVPAGGLTESNTP